MPTPATIANPPQTIMPAAALICVGFIAGSILGARFVEGIPDAVLRRVFGGVFLVLSLRMIFFK